MAQHHLGLVLSFIALTRAKYLANKSSVDVPVMIQSGISASSPMCLSVQGGQIALDGAAVVLEDCIRSVAAGDGRELWKLQPNGQLVNVVGGKCAGLVDNDVASGQIALMDCDTALKSNDGRSQFEMLGRGQLKFARRGAFCLSHTGPGAGRRNVAARAATIATSSFSVAHGAAMVVDGNEATYWASKLDDINKPVSLTINLGSKNYIEDMRIDWEFPAKAFAVHASTDGTTFHEVYSNSVNVQSTTHVVLGGKAATALKIVMQAPHAVHGRLEDHSLYGIASVGVFATQLATVVEDCAAAAKNKDARDKFFLSRAAEFDPVAEAALDNELISLEAAKSALAGVVSDLADATPRLGSCSVSTNLPGAGRKTLHLRKGMGLTQARGHEPLAVAMQGTVNVEDVHELLKEARVSILEVRKALI